MSVWRGFLGANCTAAVQLDHRGKPHPLRVWL